MTNKNPNFRFKREFNQIPSIGTKEKNHSHFKTVKKQNKPQILNQRPRRNLVSLKNPSLTNPDGTLIKPCQTPPRNSIQIVENTTIVTTDDDKEINNCFLEIDNIYKSISDYLLSPEFQDFFGSIPIPDNLISKQQ